jgi:CubicO group peptidase (beta-lactamase class C family)
VAALQLVETGKLDLACDVRQYVPEFPEKEHVITAQHLLCHQSGIPHYMPGKVLPTRREYDVPNPFEDIVVALDKFNLSPLLFQPGQRYSYTTYGYMLLGAVVERAGDQKYADQVRARILKPLDMDSMQPDYQWVDIPHSTIGYRRMPERNVLPSRDEDVSWKLAGGGFISNIGDLTRFAAGLLNKRLLSEDTYTAMWTPQLDGSGQPTIYGLGFLISERDGIKHVGHNGSQEKTRTTMVFQPETGRGVAIMCNTEGVELGDLANALLDVLAASEDAER